jgi:hypothetical protein
VRGELRYERGGSGLDPVWLIAEHRQGPAATFEVERQFAIEEDDERTRGTRRPTALGRWPREKGSPGLRGIGCGKYDGTLGTRLRGSLRGCRRLGTHPGLTHAV